MTINYLEQPSNLTVKGRKAHKTILKFLQEREMTDTGGCKAFYSPKEWTARGEQYGRESLLIVVYDGGDHRGAFNLDACLETTEMLHAEGIQVRDPYATHTAMSAELEKIGCYIEECTGWYAAVYAK
jgi:hypothetical protein